MKDFSGPKARRTAGWFLMLLCLLLTNPFFSLCFGQDKVLKVGTAGEGGSYYRLGESIKHILAGSGYHIEVVPTRGSVENIELLEQGELDLAIIQNDMAFFGEYGLYPFTGKKTSYSTVLPFYIEPIYIISSSPAIRNIRNLDGLTVNVGEIGSGLYADALIILKSNNLWETILRKNFSPSKVHELFREGVIEAAFVNSIDDSIMKDIKNGRLFVLSLSKSETDIISSTFPYFSGNTLDINGTPANTITVKSILVARSQLPSEDIYEITRLLYTNFEKLAFPGEELTLSKETTIPLMPVNKWHNGSRRYYIEKGLVESQFWWEVLWILFSVFGFLLIIVLLMNVAFLLVSRKFSHLISTNSRMFALLKKSYLYLTRHKYALIVLAVITFFLIDLVIIQKVEHEWAVQNNTVCKYDNRSFVDNIVWLFVFSGSGYSGDIFPDSSLGQILAALIPLVGLGGLVSIIGVFTSDKIRESILISKGVKTKMVKDHIIVCGYNKNVPELIKNLTHTNVIRRKRRHIILLAELGESNPLYRYGLDNEQVGYINGDATKREDLLRANLATADIAVVVSDEGADDPDASNILKILTIEKYCKELVREGKRKKTMRDIYTVAEIDDIDNSQLARDAHVDEIVGFGGLKSKILAQSILNPGVSCFVNEIFTFNDLNETYSINVGELNGVLIGHTYDELLHGLRKHNILLLSVNIHTERDGYHCERDKCAPDDMPLKVITNPAFDREKTYRVKENDVLIVLAYKGNVIEEAKKKVKEEDFRLPEQSTA